MEACRCYDEMYFNFGAFGAASIELATLVLIMYVQCIGLVDCLLWCAIWSKYTKCDYTLKELVAVVDYLLFVVKNRVSNLYIGAHGADVQFKH
jgi:hypothetical protein